jgi:hypothetical protein
MDNENLQKIDDILKRTNTDYTTAKQALEEANGDVLEAIIIIENMNKSKQKKASYTANAANAGNQILDQIKCLLSKGNATKLTIKKNNETIINLPITAGLVGAFIAPFLSAAGITAALLTQCTVEITQADGNIINVNQKVEDGVDAVKDAMQDVKQGAEEFTQDIKNTFTSSSDNDSNMNDPSQMQ